MIILKTPKGWTGPKFVDGLPVENTWRAHQVPIANVRDTPEHLHQLQEWMESYKAGELFDADGAPIAALDANRPKGERRMSANPHANGGLLTKALELPPLEPHAVDVSQGSRHRRQNRHACSASG